MAVYFKQNRFVVLPFKVLLPLCLLAVVFSFYPGSLHAQYAVDWQNAPLNPIPEMKYTLNHFNLNGTVTFKTDGEMKSTFKQGRIVHFSYKRNNRYYTYNEAGHLVREVKEGPTKSETILTCDVKGRPSITVYPEYNSTNIYTYNYKGLFTMVQYGLEKVTYAYDKKGRLSNAKNYDETGKLLAQHNYTYDAKDSGRLTVIEILEDMTNPKLNKTDTLQYNNRGHLVNRNGKSISLTYDAHGNLSTYHDVENNVSTAYEYKYGEEAAD